MSDGGARDNLKTLADGLDDHLNALETAFDPSKRLGELESFRDRLAALVPGVVAALETLRIYVSVGVISGASTPDLRAHFLKAQQLLESGSLDPERGDDFFRALRDFTRLSEDEILYGWQTYVDTQFDAREIVFMRILCRHLLSAKGVRKEERDAAEKGLELAEKLDAMRSEVSAQGEHELRVKVVQLAGMVNGLVQVRDTLIGSDPEVKSFVRSVGQENGVALEDIPKSVWEWISARGLLSAYVVTPARVRSTRR